MRVKPSQQTPFLDAFLNRTNGRLRQRVPFRRFCAFWVHHPGLTLSLACVKYSSDFGHDLFLPVAWGCRDGFHLFPCAFMFMNKFAQTEPHRPQINQMQGFSDICNSRGACK